MIDVQKVINTIDTALDELKIDIINSDFTKTESENIRKELEDTIALAEQIKADIHQGKTATRLRLDILDTSESIFAAHLNTTVKKYIW